MTAIELTPTEVWCARHLQRFRATWPFGYLPATMVLFASATMRDDVMAACAGDARQLNRVLREFGPLCCLVTAGDLERAYRYAFADDMAEATALARHLIAWGRTAP